MRVTIQVQLARKPYAWQNVFPARVLFANRDLIVVKGCGSHSFFYGTGDMRMSSYNPQHPHAKSVPDRHGRWRIHPDSLKRIKAKLVSTRREGPLEATRGTSRGSGSKGAPSPAGPRRSAPKASRLPKKARPQSTRRRGS